MSFNSNGNKRYNDDLVITSNSSTKINTESFLKNEGILNNEEQYETVYLAEDEIEKFMEKYVAENPGVEIETRYIKQPPIEVVQDIHVRWLRPPTPEMPPIIIREVNVQEKERLPLRVIEKPRQFSGKQQNSEPIVIREKPPMMPIPEPKIAFVQNVVKRDSRHSTSGQGQGQGSSYSQSQQSYIQSYDRKSQNSSHALPLNHEIKIEHVNSTDNNGSRRNLSRNSYEQRQHEEHLYQHQKQENQQVQQQSTFVDFSEALELRYDGSRCLEGEEIYEDKLKQNVFNDRDSHLEQQRTIFEQRNSCAEDRRLSSGFGKGFSLSSASPRLDQRSRQEYNSREDQNSQNITPNNRLNYENSLQGQSKLNATPIKKNKSDTSSYKNILFKKVTDENELARFNAIYENPNTPHIRNKIEGDKIMSAFEITNNATNFNNTSSNNQSFSNNFSNNNNLNNSNRSNIVSSARSASSNCNQQTQSKAERREYQTKTISQQDKYSTKSNSQRYNESINQTNNYNVTKSDPKIIYNSSNIIKFCTDLLNGGELNESTIQKIITSHKTFISTTNGSTPSGSDQSYYYDKN